MSIQVEPYSAELMDEALPLLQAHWEEVAFYKDVPLDPHLENYKLLNDVGCLKIITARINKELVGYTVFLISQMAHYKTQKIAQQDVFFVRQDKRKTMMGVGITLLNESERVLSELDVDVVQHHVKVYKDFGPMLEKFGYTFVEKIYQKRL
jgi:hypothetical protein